MATSPDGEDVFAQVELGAGEIARLVELGERLAPELPAIAARFYAWIAARPPLAAVLRDDAQVARLTAALIDWMASGLRGPYDKPFYAKRARIGRQHVASGLPQQSMFTAMNLLRGEYHRRIDALYPVTEARLVAHAVDKLLDVELALMLRHYQLDSEERLVARERSAQADRVAAIQTLSAGLAHELRNPLNSAKLQLELLERRLRREVVDHRLDGKLIEPVEVIHQELERLTRLVGEFLAFARPSALVVEDLDVLAVIREVVGAESARGVALLAPSGSLPARADPAKLRQIVHNLVRNAIEAVGGDGRVEVSASAEADKIRIAVEDNGPGIPAHVQRRIYEPFFTTKDTGTGLGLSIVHGMVGLHGGTIALTSGPHGTRFDVALPRQPG